MAVKVPMVVSLTVMPAQISVRPPSKARQGSDGLSTGGGYDCPEGGLPIHKYRHTVRLLGPSARGRHVSGSVLRDLLDILIEGSRGVVRLHAQGRSVWPGTPPRWLESAADFDVLPLEEGSTIIPLEAPALAAAAPERFAQESFLAPVSHRSALSLFEESLEAAMAGDEESETFDPPLLERFQQFTRLLADGVEEIELRSVDETAPSSPACVRIESSSLATIDRLIQKTPPSQRARLAGRLDTIRHHDRMFRLQLDSGQTVTGLADAVAEEALAGLWGQEVMVSGVVSFRPSGSVLRIDADAIEPAKGATGLWSQVPKPVFHRLDVRSLHKVQGPRSGLNALYGKWPGDETDEEIEDALAELS